MIIDKVIPKPGEGPTKRERESGFFSMGLYGKHSNGRIVRARVKGDRDPGYGSTSSMLGEAAVCLAPDDLSIAGGSWTPASALGTVLRHRLEKNAGLSFQVWIEGAT